MVGQFIRSTIYGYFLKKFVRLGMAILFAFCAAGVLFGGFFAHVFVFVVLLTAAVVLIAGEIV